MIVTVSSSFGSNGAVIAAQVAERLGWPLHNRAIPAEVAEQLSVELDSALVHDENVPTVLTRLLVRLAGHLMLEPGVSLPREVNLNAEQFRQASERAIHRIAEEDAVIIGRAAAIVLAGRPDALHVRFDAPRDARLERARNVFGLSKDEAARRLAATDRARAMYVRTYYKHDWADSSLYHLTVDSSALSVETCTDIVLVAIADRRVLPEADTSSNHGV
jgi:cytidylate kinase